MTEKHLTIHTDGGARGNPGPAAIGAIIKHNDEVVKTISRCIGPTTNNQAEYQALHAALEYALAEQATSVDIFCDSELVVNQIKGRYKMKNKDLGLWFLKIHAQLQKLQSYTITAVRREQNEAADALVNAALDAEAHA